VTRFLGKGQRRGLYLRTPETSDGVRSFEFPRANVKKRHLLAPMDLQVVGIAGRHRIGHNLVVPGLLNPLVNVDAMLLQQLAKIPNSSALVRLTAL
jgi:hypothetical protein